MPRDIAALRQHITTVITRQVSRSDSLRQEAIREFLAVTRPDLAAEAAGVIAATAPPLLPQLYARWIDMFADRLFETVPLEQIELFCDGAQDNDAALVLAYIMFLESARMERQIAEDLAGFGQDGVDETLAAYVWSQLGSIDAHARLTAERKAAQYRVAVGKGRLN